MLEEYMKQLEAVIDKDEYDLSNFEEKILKREELLSKNNQQKNEEPEANQSDEKLLYSEASTTNIFPISTHLLHHYQMV